MFERLKELFAARGASPNELTESHATAFAAAMLLLEVAWADHEIATSEMEAARRGISRLFGLTSEETNAIIARAHREHAASTSIFPFTRELNAALPPVAKRQLVSMLWRLAYTDAVLTGYEEHAIRRIADLLHLSHGDFIAAKLTGRDDGNVSAKPPRES